MLAGRALAGGAALLTGEALLGSGLCFPSAKGNLWGSVVVAGSLVERGFFPGNVNGGGPLLHGQHGLSKLHERRFAWLATRSARASVIGGRRSSRTGTPFRSGCARGYMEEGTTTTPFHMVMRNGIDRFQLALGVLDQLPGLREQHSALCRSLLNRRIGARNHTLQHGEDPEQIRNWTLD
jgi:hypothetical protein